MSEALTSWSSVDLREVVKGGYVHPPPTVLARDDGACLFYPRLVHWVQGEPESLKGWLAQLAAAQQLAADHHVIYLDFEDSEHGVVPRMLALPDVTAAVVVERFHYIRPSEPLDDEGRSALEALLKLGPTLAVVDGVTDAMALHDLNPEKNPDVAKFHRMLLRPVADAGPATVAIDHVTKDREKRGNWAIGGQHKKGALRGAAYTVDLVTPFGVGRHGVARITVAKDTPGRVREHAADGKHAGDLHLQSEPNGTVTAEIRAPELAKDGKGREPREVMEQISRFLEDWPDGGPGPSGNVILTSEDVKGKTERKRLALELLEAKEFVCPTPGAGRAKYYRSVRPFRAIPMIIGLPSSER